MKIDAGSKVKTARTWLCFQRPCASVVSGDVRVTMRITLLTRKCPAVRFALLVENISARVCRVTARHKQADKELADNFESFDFEFARTIYEFRV